MLEDVTRRLGWEPCSCVMSRARKVFSGGRPGAPTCWIDGCVWRLRPSGSRPLIVCFRSAPDSRDGFSLGPSAGGGLPPGFVPEHKTFLTVQPVFVSTATEMVFPPSGAAWKVCFSFETFSCCFVLERVKTSSYSSVCLFCFFSPMTLDFVLEGKQTCCMFWTLHCCTLCSAFVSSSLRLFVLIE